MLSFQFLVLQLDIVHVCFSVPAPPQFSLTTHDVHSEVLSLSIYHTVFNLILIFLVPKHASRFTALPVYSRSQSFIIVI